MILLASLTVRDGLSSFFGISGMLVNSHVLRINSYCYMTLQCLKTYLDQNTSIIFINNFNTDLHSKLQ